MGFRLQLAVVFLLWMTLETEVKAEAASDSKVADAIIVERKRRHSGGHGFTTLVDEDEDKSNADLVANCGLGMKSGDIADSQISASSDYTPSFNGKYGRLDWEGADTYFLGQSYGCWLPTKLPMDKQWIRIDLLKPTLVAGVVTQGRPKHYDQWVTSYAISCSRKPKKMHRIKENRIVKIFTGNTDRNSTVYNALPKPKRCRYVWLHPVTWEGTVGLRMELIRGRCT